nr:MAG TPA: hypothetical protein [Caudoviricetes sp.]
MTYITCMRMQKQLHYRQLLCFLLRIVGKNVLLRLRINYMYITLVRKIL